ncbi:unnamed protein product [Ceratitis capitata]|uniref:(Mediterranean fruit fly) hypothetical protein n=1 Tax=Ceratitis capitata TaxID=7213 RepID=A0A811UF70_CERCA|nr:unnamed protein product [Ceratitis capitata]
MPSKSEKKKINKYFVHVRGVFLAGVLASCGLLLQPFHCWLHTQNPLPLHMAKQTSQVHHSIVSLFALCLSIYILERLRFAIALQPELHLTPRCAALPRS